jgi:3-phosphoshikimate 1-carboxyvinyltransferase
MAMAVAGLVADGPVEIDDADAVEISYPGFFNDLRALTRRES